MRIFNNVNALIAVNQMNKNTALQGNSMQKLSTGLRINKAGDDAAGLAISEEMRARIRGLDKGSKNVQDGISLVQTAEGALEEIQNMIGRMNELAIQSANGTLTDSDREKINAEANNLIDEIAKITEDTNFNGIKILQGNKETITDVKFSTSGSMPSWVTVPTQLSSPSLLDPPDFNGKDRPNGNYAYATIDFSAFDSTKINDLLGNGFFSTCCTCHETYNIKFTNTTPNPPTSSPVVIEVDISKASTAKELVEAIVSQAEPKLTHFTEFMVDSNNPNALIIYDNRRNQQPNPTQGRGVVGQGIATQAIVTSTPPQPDIYIQYADDETSSMPIQLPNTLLDSIGIDGIDLSTQIYAQAALHSIKEGIEYISTERAKMGAYDNVLEVKSNVNTTHTENLTSAESRIRDVDIAKEMIKLSKINIITQASQSMIAQAKQQPQGIMNLLN